MFGWLFGNKEEEKVEEILVEPEIGSRWIISSGDDPWGDPHMKPVRIIDCKEGWVRYYMGSIFSDQRMELKTFLSIYREKRD